MKLGKRHQDTDAPGAPAVPASAADSTASPQETDGRTVPVAEPQPTPAPGARVAADEPVAHEQPVLHEEPPVHDEPLVHEQPVVEGEAVELPADEPVAPMTIDQRQRAPGAMPFPVAGEPVAVVASAPGPTPVTALGDSAAAYASGHSAAPGQPWQEPVTELANERPELVVAAAFAGGLLAAMILRRLGS